MLIFHRFYYWELEIQESRLYSKYDGSFLYHLLCLIPFSKSASSTRFHSHQTKWRFTDSVYIQTWWKVYDKYMRSFKTVVSNAQNKPRLVVPIASILPC